MMVTLEKQRHEIAARIVLKVRHEIAYRIVLKVHVACVAFHHTLQRRARIWENNLCPSCAGRNFSVDTRGTKLPPK